VAPLSNRITSAAPETVRKGDEAEQSKVRNRKQKTLELPIRNREHKINTRIRELAPVAQPLQIVAEIQTIHLDNNKSEQPAPRQSHCRSYEYEQNQSHHAAKPGSTSASHQPILKPAPLQLGETVLRVYGDGVLEMMAKT